MPWLNVQWVTGYNATQPATPHSLAGSGKEGRTMPWPRYQGLTDDVKSPGKQKKRWAVWKKMEWPV